MKTKDILLELIELLGSFEETLGNAEDMSLESFLSYAVSIRKSEQDFAEDTMHSKTDEAYIARMLSLIHRFSRGYTKKALMRSECLQTEEEYTYLVCLMDGQAKSKGELHTANGLERTTGSEMLRRLQRYGLIHEFVDPKDKRQRLVQITPEGRQELVSVFPGLRDVAQIISAPLDDRQKVFLKAVLVQMSKAHSDAIGVLKDAPLEDYMTYLKK